MKIKILQPKNYSTLLIHSKSSTLNNPTLSQTLISTKFVFTETPTPHKTTHLLPYISWRNTVKIRFAEQNLWGKKGIVIKQNKENDKRFNNRGCSLLFLMRIFLKHLRLIPNILQWQEYKIFTKLDHSQALL